MRVSWYRYHEWNIYGYSIFMIYIHRYISFSWYIIEKPSLDIYIYPWYTHINIIQGWFLYDTWLFPSRTCGSGAMAPWQNFHAWKHGATCDFRQIETKKHLNTFKNIYTEIVDIYSGKMLTFSIYLFGGWYTLSSSGEIFWTYSAGIAAGKSSEWSCKAQPDHISSVSFQSPVDW